LIIEVRCCAKSNSKETNDRYANFHIISSIMNLKKTYQIISDQVFMIRSNIYQILVKFKYYKRIIVVPPNSSKVD
jgi:hypothetical protein